MMFSIGAVSQHPDCLKYCKLVIPALRSLEKKFNREQFIERFGPPVKRKKNEYALSVGNLEALSFSGLGTLINQDRLVESYSVTKNAMIEVYYEDRKTAVGIMLWFRVDNQMPAISKKDLASRLKWEEGLFKEFSSELERKPESKGK
jgi:hypothetical protein